MRTFGGQGIPLNSVGIDGKKVSPKLIAEGVQAKGHVIVGAVALFVHETLPRNHTGTNLFRIGVESDKDDVKILPIKAQISLGSLSGRLSVARFFLKGIGHPFQLSFHLTRGFHVGKIFQCRHPFQRGDFQIEGRILGPC